MNPSIGIIGAGNLAFHLAKAFHKSGCPPIFLAARNTEKLSDFIPFLSKQTIISPLEAPSPKNLDLVILAVSDDAIASVSGALQFSERTLVVHTSGSKPMELLKESGIKDHGVLYPLQSFSKSKTLDYSEVQFFIETNSEPSLQRLQTIVSRISRKVNPLSSEKRLRLHLAAVIANNFTNLLYAISEEQLKLAGLDLFVLEHLIRETTEKALELSPKAAQTGPAIRGDQEIIQSHLKMLEDQPKIQQMYDLLSNLIAQKLKH
ncbi:Rossmann-like and DUF2520 domain-containing protein [Marinoscillum sp. MHG1-6]|uniref:Rossmann-like and DUF2520 domain-containing protein n=1 Tax=Marinoscillum sp. MHG1-6 TaxID=2959627 RepID=UPI0021572E55|nr:Rossmann-like and DUF2520 domain-containing protein [Marinoscillum sp. MHG1-6]